MKLQKPLYCNTLLDKISQCPMAPFTEDAQFLRQTLQATYEFLPTIIITLCFLKMPKKMKQKCTRSAFWAHHHLPMAETAALLTSTSGYCCCCCGRIALVLSYSSGCDE